MARRPAGRIGLKLLGVLCLAAGCLMPPAPCAAAAPLPALNAEEPQSSISGISSGAFMAVQFGTAWSSIIRGVGVIAGGPFYCAQASSADILNAYILPILTATGPCMTGPPPDLATLTATADTMAQSGAIDSLSNIAGQKIYVFHGYNDAVVAGAVTDGTVGFYRHYLGPANRGNLFYQTTIGAGHSQVVAGQAGANPCPANQPPYIDQCGYDQAGILLQHIYGALNPPNRGAPAGVMSPFDQAAYTQPFSTTVMSLADTGYVYVPNACAQGAPCRVHIALHGCKQDAGDIGSTYIDDAGYNAWADSNNIIVLYPQTQVGTGFGVAPLNPQACWDWFGYVNQDASYVTKGGRQIAAIKAMLDAVTAGATVMASPVVAAVAGPPADLAVTDVSDTAAALAWRPVPGADSYRIERAGADGMFSLAGVSQSGPSYGDFGLTPDTSYAWRVTPISGGVAGPASAAVAAATRPPAAVCTAPGTCP